MSAINTTAPDFTLRDHNRDTHTLSEHQGGRVVLAFFPAAFTGVCEKEMCTFRDGMAALEGLNATVFGISVDAPWSNAAFVAKNQLNFSLLSDYSRSTIQAYGVALENFAGMDGYTVAQRSVFIIDEKGVIVYEWIAPNPGVEPNYDEIQAFLR